VNPMAGAVSGLRWPPTLAVPSATGVDASIVLAGPGARAMAFLVDFLLRSALSILYMLLASLILLGNMSFNVGPDDTTTWLLVGVVPATIIYFLYHVILEPLMSGRTPGKRMAGLRVLTLDGRVPTTSALIVRNVFRLIDSMPVGYVVGLLFVFFGKRHLRLGDLAAGTVLAVERAPFLEKLALERPLPDGRGPDAHAAWHAVRQRAASLKRRAGSNVDDALAVVDDYRRAAREINAARIAAVAGAGAGATGAWLVFTSPDLIALFAGPELIATVERGELWTDGMLNAAPSAVYSVDILTNNIVVSFFAFTLGLFFGIGTLYIIGMNGLSLGALFAFTGQHGLAGGLFDFVIAHGCVELSCIAIAGAAGAYIGDALARPGERTRAESFRAAASDGIRVMVAVTLLLFVCGFIEGYVSPDPEVPRWARVVVGVGYWIFMISFLRGYVFGRSRGGPPIDS
jgi:uncharacterized membrane protein SpoIIM required for sporulation/uncharacterized RDD family membrane protein YckC